VSDQTTLEQFKAEKYPVKVFFDEDDGVYVTEFLDLPGCSAYGDTVEDSYRRAEEAKAEWLRVSLEQGLPIPKPSKPEDHSGRILLRLPSSLHGLLADRAKLHGASLNQYILHLLSSAAVGDELSTQVEALTRRLGQLEFRIGQLAANLKPPQISVSQPKFQVSTGTNPYMYTPTALYVGSGVELASLEQGWSQISNRILIGTAFQESPSTAINVQTHDVQSQGKKERTGTR
jgi:antitoxin HicB